MARGILCWFGMHRWAKHHRDGEPYLACVRCDKESTGPSPLLGGESGGVG